MFSSVPDHDLKGQLRRLQRFRRRVYECFTAWPDALFETVDALLCVPSRPQSWPHLSLEPALRRGHGSQYAALARGRIDTTVLAGVLAGALDPGAGLVFALDCSQWPRPGAACSPGRMLNYDACKDEPGSGAPVTAGWWFSVLAQTGTGRSSWATPLEVAFIGPDGNHNRTALAQIRGLLDRLSARGLPQTPMVCLDGGYSPAFLGQQLAGVGVQILVRLRSDRVLLGAPPPRPAGRTGRSQVHGEAMKLSDTSTWPEPDETMIVDAQPERGHAALSIVAWHDLHPRHTRGAALHEADHDPRRNTTRRIARGSVILIRSADPALKPMWLFWAGPEGTFDLDRVWRAYLRRYDIEALFRFCKQYLAWTLPQPRTPDQALRWSWLVLIAYTHLVLARDLVGDHRLPWQRPGHLSPLRVKQGFRRLAPHLGTPTKPPKPSRPGPGRPTGRTSTPAPRHRWVKKPAKT